VTINEDLTIDNFLENPSPHTSEILGIKGAFGGIFSFSFENFCKVYCNLFIMQITW